MPVRTSYDQGTPSWVDLMTTDPAAAQEFYGGLFGWEFETNPVPDGQEYIMASLKGKSAAGLGQQAAEQAEMGIPPMWNTYIAVDDIEAATAKAEGAGGSVMMAPMEVMDAGHMAVVVDPTGAVVCLWQANRHIGSEIVNEHGAVTWTELMTSDVAAATPFYKSVLGVETVEQDMGAPEPYTLFMVGDDMVAGALTTPMEGIPNHWVVYFHVDDLDAAIAKATDLGGTAMGDVMTIPTVGRMVPMRDPQGAGFMLLEPETQD